MEKECSRKKGFYEKYLKRPQDFLCALLALIILSPVLLIMAVVVRVKLGSPVLFTQERPGLDERIFKMYKFRSMTDKRNENGELLPDEVRLTPFGKKLRATSLDELPELFNILRGDMSIVGPRPQLVRDMVFMTKEQRRRHSVRPGLSGLAQVNGRNAISWENKMNYDLRYIEKITFWGDVQIIFQTVIKSLVRHEGITDNNMVTAEDLGDYLLRTGKIEKDKYDELQMETKEILEAGNVK